MHRRVTAMLAATSTAVDETGDQHSAVSTSDSDEWVVEAAALGVLQGKKVSEFINDTDALRAVTRELAPSTKDSVDTERSQFAERFQVTVPSVLELPGGTDINQDQELETRFRAIAALGAWIGTEWCAAHGIRTERPADYFAEMLKSDDHMARVRKALLEERQRLHEIQRIRAEALTRLEAKRRQREARVRLQESKRAGFAEVEQWKREQGLSSGQAVGSERYRQRVVQRNHSKAAGRPRGKRREIKKRPGKKRREQLRARRQQS